MAELVEPRLEELLGCVEREISLRRRVYPRWVAQNKLTQEKADREIALMEAVAKTLRGMSAMVDLFAAAAAVVSVADHLGHQGFRANLADAVMVCRNAGFDKIADEVLKISQ